MILCVGPTGAGKTSLLKCLSRPADKLTFSVPTTGVNIVNLQWDKKRSVTIHELGGTMSPIWERHLEDCRALLYVLDSRNLQQVSCATVRLMELLSNPALPAVPVLVILNKIDLSSTTDLSEMRDIMHLKEICLQARQSVSVVEVSCVSTLGLERVKNWLLQLDNREAM